MGGTRAEAPRGFHGLGGQSRTVSDGLQAAACAHGHVGGKAEAGAEGSWLVGHKNALFVFVHFTYYMK